MEYFTKSLKSIESVSHVHLEKSPKKMFGMVGKDQKPGVVIRSTSSAVSQFRTCSLQRTRFFVDWEKLEPSRC